MSVAFFNPAFVLECHALWVFADALQIEALADREVLALGVMFAKSDLFFVFEVCKAKATLVDINIFFLTTSEDAEHRFEGTHGLRKFLGWLIVANVCVDVQVQSGSS